jgi:segregation and condensation protein A
VRREELSVREQMTKVLRRLRDTDFVLFEELFELEDSIPHLVVTFIAILELAKECLVEITQTETLGNIYVRTSRAITAE